MLDSILSETTTASSINFADIAICTGVALVLGIIIAFVYMYKSTYTKNFVITLALLPAIVQSVIMVVNGNLGASVAVMGAFGLVRFRSIPGTAKEIASIFFAMAAGLAVGMGYVIYAAIFTAIISIMMILYSSFNFGEKDSSVKRLKITIPEDLDYEEAFADLFPLYTSKTSLDKVRTTNLGSLFELQYTVTLKKDIKEKDFIDKIRQRNGNLNIVCGKIATVNDEL